MPISTVKYQKTFNNAMFKWIWTIFSLGAPVTIEPRSHSLRILHVNSVLTQSITSLVVAAT